MLFLHFCLRRSISLNLSCDIWCAMRVPLKLRIFTIAVHFHWLLLWDSHVRLGGRPFNLTLGHPNYAIVWQSNLCESTATLFFLIYYLRLTSHSYPDVSYRWRIGTVVMLLFMGSSLILCKCHLTLRWPSQGNVVRGVIIAMWNE